MSIPERSSEAAAAPEAAPRPEAGAECLASPVRRRRLVARVLGVPEARIATVEVRAGRERFGRTTAFVRVGLDDGAGSADERRLVAKLYRDAAGADAYRVCEALHAAGMRPLASATVPAVPAYLPAERLLWMEHAPGRSWLERLVADAPDEDDPLDPTAACHRAAEWLLALHGLPDRAPPDTARRLHRVLVSQPIGGSAGGAGHEVADRCRDLADRLPALALRLAPWPQRLGPELVAAESVSGATRPRPSHGDFHPGNLLLSAGPEARVTAVDLDGVALREPAFDAGSAVGQLLAMSDLQEWPEGGAAAGARAAVAFWNRYRDGVHGPERDLLEERTGVHALATLLGVLHYSFAMETRRRDLAERWLPGLEAWWDVRGDGVAAGVERFAGEVSS